MLKKTLLALSVAWTGTAAAASNSLDDVTMNIVDETAFQEILAGNPAEIEKILQETGDGKAVRTFVFRSFDGKVTAGTPNEELDQGMVTFSFVCSDAQETCEKRAAELNSTGGFKAGMGTGVQRVGSGTDGAPTLTIHSDDGATSDGPTLSGDGAPDGATVYTDRIGDAGTPVKVGDLDGPMTSPASGQ
jgi:hypothetical protein